MGSSNGFSDFSSISNDVDIAAWICSRRDSLEAIVAPHVTKTKTAFGIAFQGKRRYLKSWPNINALLALQSLYKLEAAREASDVDEIVRATSIFVKYDNEVENQAMWGTTSTSALAEFARGKGRRKRNGENSKTLTSNDEVSALNFAFAKYGNEIKGYDKIANKLMEMGYGRKAKGGEVKKLTAKTVRKRCKELGLSENA